MIVHIIGAGPAGSHTAKLFARAGFSVQVWEEHSQIGYPVQCTGIVTSELKNLVRLRPEFTLNRLKKVKVHSTDHSTLIGANDFVLDRGKFDRYLAKEAEDAGARFNLSYRFIGLKSNELMIEDKKNNKIKKIKFTKEDYLIGADGPQSTISKIIGNKQLKFWTGIQARIKTKTKKDLYEVWFGDIAPDFFAWSVPESIDVTRVGLAGMKNVNALFNSFLDKNFKNKKIIEMQGGLIPKFNPNIRVQKNNIFIIGDAAGHVKATTGGGIVPGLQAAECLAQAIIEDKDYRKLLNKKVIPNLKKHLLIRNLLDKFNDKDYDELVKIINNEKIKELLEKEHRDKNPAMIAMKAIIKQSKLLKFVKVLWK
ncbi:MAG: NAD(P)/FAD-dependent oxidoreductase [Nanoarchaeota archaeon]|nr:NAD(P)/FAD-dependent oxidoreductase [Nanoarchaeota archaeon]